MKSQSSYLPDMFAYEFFLFLKLKRIVKGRRFSNTENLKIEFPNELKTVVKIASQKCWHRSVISHGKSLTGTKLALKINKRFLRKIKILHILTKPPIRERSSENNIFSHVTLFNLSEHSFEIIALVEFLLSKLLEFSKLVKNNRSDDVCA